MGGQLNVPDQFSARLLGWLQMALLYRSPYRNAIFHRNSFYWQRKQPDRLGAEFQDDMLQILRCLIASTLMPMGLRWWRAF